MVYPRIHVSFPYYLLELYLYLSSSLRGRYRYFPGEIEAEGRKEAARKATEWGDRKNTVWTDGSMLEDGRVGAACM